MIIRAFQIIGALFAALVIAAFLFYLVIAISIGGIPRAYEMPFHLTAYIGYALLAVGFVGFVMRKALFTWVGYGLPVLICLVFIILANLHTPPQRRILVEENYQPPQRPQTAQPVPAPQNTDDLIPMPGDDENTNHGND